MTSRITKVADFMPEYTQITKIGTEWVCTYPIEGSSPGDSYRFTAKTPLEALELAYEHFENKFYVIGKVHEKMSSVFDGIDPADEIPDDWEPENRPTKASDTNIDKLIDLDVLVANMLHANPTDEKFQGIFNFYKEELTKMILERRIEELERFSERKAVDQHHLQRLMKDRIKELTDV